MSSSSFLVGNVAWVLTVHAQTWKKKTPTKKITFFTIPEYEKWAEECPDIHNWDYKYYKVGFSSRLRKSDIYIRAQGLGTSKDEDAREYFSDMAKHMIPFSTTQDGDRDLIDLAFSKKKADDRKEWLRNFVVRTPASASG
jgi:DNA topoisomerase-2